MLETTSAESKQPIHRALWFAVVYPTVLTLAYFVWLAEFPDRVQQLVYSVGKLVQFGFPIAWVAAFARRRLRWQRPAASGMPLGVAFGLVVFAATLLLYFFWLKQTTQFDQVEAVIREKVKGFGLIDRWQYVSLAVFYALGHSFLEEYYWRWFVFGEMRRLMSPGKAILLSSVGFAAHHVVLLAYFFGLLTLETAVFSAAVAVGGAAWAWLYQRGDSLAAPWISHLLVDAAIFTVGYDVVADLYVT